MRIAFLAGLVSMLIAGCAGGGLQRQDACNAPPDPLERLDAGNERYREFHPLHPDEGLDRMRELVGGQHPIAAVVACSDSRVPPELVFDQGLGDLFTIRTAGNVLGDYELASVEYAVEHLGVSLVVVMGHTGCGAIETYIEHRDDHVHGYLDTLLQHIRNEPEEGEAARNGVPTVDEATRANILHGMAQLVEEHSITGELVRAGRVRMIGALYHLDDGHVEWIRE